MGDQKKLCAAVLAHVDAGKTTLSEALLYVSGSIRKAGRVDNGDAFLDTYELERTRGITIFSKQAQLKVEDLCVTLLDTPGHVDFSAEMERTLQVLDYAVLVISGADGIQGHTETLWRLLQRYGIPVFLFVNKMDQEGAVKEALMLELKEKLHEDCLDFTDAGTDEFFEQAAMSGEDALEEYLNQGMLSKETLQRLIGERKLFPCYFGSALKMEGVKEFLHGFYEYTRLPEYPNVFGAKVFKIARDEQGTRLTYLKVTGGSLKVKMQLLGHARLYLGDSKEAEWHEKVNQIRIYSGERYETAEEVEAGTVCAVTGLSRTYPGEGLGIEPSSAMPVLEPVITCRMDVPKGMDAAQMLPKLRQLEEEEPELHIVWDPYLKALQAQIMGEVQVEVLKSLIKERFGADVEFGEGNIVYKETIADTVEGVGHYEPLRHYAEVHLLLEPGEPGSGLTFAADCSEELLERNWQRLVLTHLEERDHAGVLIGAPVTDMKITLAAGRAHQKHTEGGDFRQAVYRAVRHGLMQAKSVLLEPYFEFRLTVPGDLVGRAMTDIERMHGTFVLDAERDREGPKESGPAFRQHLETVTGGRKSGGMRLLCGYAPVSTLQNYQKEVTAYTKGRGRLNCTLAGYRPCHNEAEVIEKAGYDPARDTENPADSVFCAHGAGFVVGWEQVTRYMHIESVLQKRHAGAKEWVPDYKLPQRSGQMKEVWIGTDEIDRILEQTYNANKRNKSIPPKHSWKLKGHGSTEVPVSAVTRSYQQKTLAEEYLLVDGYNIIFAWEDLKELAAANIDSARGKLLDILSNYQGICSCHLIVVFDAYRVAGHKTEVLEYHNIHVVYTKEAETADQYIEKFAHENGSKFRVTVATSDGLEQIIIRGSGCALLSAREFEQEVIRKNAKIQEMYHENQQKDRNYLLESIPENIRKEAGQESEE